MIAGSLYFLARLTGLQDQLIDAARQAAPLSPIRSALLQAAGSLAHVGPGVPTMPDNIDAARAWGVELNRLADDLGSDALRRAAQDYEIALGAALRRVAA